MAPEVRTGAAKLCVSVVTKPADPRPTNPRRSASVIRTGVGGNSQSSWTLRLAGFPTTMRRLRQASLRSRKTATGVERLRGVA